MSGIVSLLLLAWTLTGVEVAVHPVDGSVRFTDLYGSERTAMGALACERGRPPELWLSRSADLATVAHELAHALDCLDDGALNGSPRPQPHARPAWASDYCWSSPVEWYACAAVRDAQQPRP